MNNKKSNNLNNIAKLVGLLLLMISMIIGLSACSKTSTTKTSSDKMFTDRDFDSSYDEKDATKIKLTDSKITTDGEGAAVDGTTVTLSKEGTYIVSGSSSNAQIIVEASKTTKVQVVLDNVTINRQTSAPIYVKQADKVFLTMAKGSTNTLSNSEDFVAIDDNNIDGVIFAKDDITINGAGTLNVNANYGHGIVCKDDLKITEGTINVTPATDGLQGKSSVRIGGGDINITKSVEGIEGAMIYMCDGTVKLNASDDGLNASSDAVSSEDMMAVDENCSIIITGGKLNVSADGDGIDSNGTLEVSGGEIYVDGPTNGGNGALDVAGDAKITGGTVVMAGSVGMATNFTEATNQGSMLVSISGNAGDTITVKDSDGNEVLSYTPSKTFACAVISSPKIKKGSTYTVSTSSGSSTVTMDDMLYSDVQGGMGGGGGQPGGGGQGGDPGAGGGQGGGGRGGDPGAGGGRPQ